jgi:glycosyltransferase involved in cell wall biosynthesis
MRIFVITSSYPGSDGRLAGPFIKQLHDHLLNCCSIIVLTPHYRGGKLSEIFDGIRIIRHPYFFPMKFQVLTREGGLAYNFIHTILGKIQLPLFIITQIIAAICITAWFRPDIIHSQWLIPQGLSGAICSRIFSIPHVSTIHSSEITFIQRYQVAQWIARFIIKNTDTLTSVSTHRLDELFQVDGISSEKPRIQKMVVPNGVDENFFFYHRTNLEKELIKEVFTLLFVGRLIDIKGIQYLILAIPLINRRFPNIKLLIIGSGSQKEKLIRKVAELGLDRNISFIGQIQPNKLPGYYAAADIVVFPSITDDYGFTEGLPVVVLEALAAGRPIVASRIPGVCEIIEDGINGLLVDEKSPEQIADAVIRLIDDKTLYNQIRQQAQKSAEKYNWKHVSKQYLDLYTSMINISERL